jgi:hypothetical protein
MNPRIPSAPALPIPLPAGQHPVPAAKAPAVALPPVIRPLLPSTDPSGFGEDGHA